MRRKASVLSQSMAGEPEGSLPVSGSATTWAAAKATRLKAPVGFWTAAACLSACSSSSVAVET